jgi:hypothetical protein
VSFFHDQPPPGVLALAFSLQPYLSAFGGFSSNQAPQYIISVKMFKCIMKLLDKHRCIN